MDEGVLLDEANIRGIRTSPSRRIGRMVWVVGCRGRFTDMRVMGCQRRRGVRWTLMRMGRVRWMRTLMRTGTRIDEVGVGVYRGGWSVLFRMSRGGITDMVIHNVIMDMVITTLIVTDTVTVMDTIIRMDIAIRIIINNSSSSNSNNGRRQRRHIIIIIGILDMGRGLVLVLVLGRGLSLRLGVVLVLRWLSWTIRKGGE